MSILITGASRGIGRALAETFRAQGDAVIGTARNPGPGDVALDVADPASIQALALKLDGTPVDTLICNAGVYLDKGHDLETGYAPELWAQSFAVNVSGVFLTIQALLPNLRAGQNPKIAILSSAMGSDERAPGGAYIYRASKAAVLNLGRNLATDLKSDGIAVGIYHPGWVQTEMGGGAADIDVATSVQGLVARIDALTPERSGTFETYDGTPIPY